MIEKTLYERLGGAFAIAALMERFSVQVLENPLVGTASRNPGLRASRTQEADGRLPGLKFMRILWLCAVTGGPFKYTGRPLGPATRDLQITPEEFDEVAAEFGRTLDHFKVPKREKGQVLAAFARQKDEVTAAAVAKSARSRSAAPLRGRRWEAAQKTLNETTPRTTRTRTTRRIHPRVLMARA